MVEKETKEIIRNQKIFYIIMGACGGVWIVTGIAAVVTLAMAVFTDLSWWWPVGLEIVSITFKGAAKEYRKEYIKLGIKLRDLADETGLENS